MTIIFLLFAFTLQTFQPAWAISNRPPCPEDAMLKASWTYEETVKVTEEMIRQYIVEYRQGQEALRKLTNSPENQMAIEALKTRLKNIKALFFAKYHRAAFADKSGYKASQLIRRHGETFETLLGHVYERIEKSLERFDLNRQPAAKFLTFFKTDIFYYFMTMLRSKSQEKFERNINHLGSDKSDTSPTFKNREVSNNEYETMYHELLEEAAIILNPREFMLLTRYYFDEITLKNLGDEVDLTPERVRQIIERAKEKLRERLSPIYIEFFNSRDEE